MTDFRALCAELVDDLELCDWPYKLKETIRADIDRARAVLARWGTSNLTQTWRSPADGAVEGLTRDDVLRWLQQDQAWGVLVAPTEWRPVDDEWLNLIHRAVLARWGNPAPQPPAEGEVEELVVELRMMASQAAEACQFTDAENLSRAADLLSIAYATGPELWEPIAQLPRQRHPAPVPVAERLPGPEDCDAEGRCWWWCPSHPESGYLEGWVLRPSSWGVGHYDFDDSVIHTHWLPAHALPVPGQEVE